MVSNRSLTTKPRKPRVRKALADDAQQELEVTSSADSDDQDFGAGIVDDDIQSSAAPKAKARRKTTRKKAPVKAVETGVTDAEPAESAPVRKAAAKTRTRRTRPVSAEVEVEDAPVAPRTPREEEPAPKKLSRVARNVEDESVFDGDFDVDFGDDDGDQPPAARSPRREPVERTADRGDARRSRRDERRDEQSIADRDRNGDGTDHEGVDRVSTREAAADSGEHHGGEHHSGGEHRPRQEGDRPRPAGDDDQPRRKRRRRKRRRGGEQGETARPAQPAYRSGPGGQSGQGGGSRGGRNQGGGGGRRHQNNQQQSDRNRGRRVTKFEQNAAPSEPAVTSGTIEGVLELHPKAYGFLRSAANDYGAREVDPFVSSSFVEKHGLREGIMIRGEVGPGTRGQGPRLLSIESIDGRPVEEFEKIKHFDTLTPINPFEQIKLETGPQPVTMRVMDLLTPIGKGQRALIVAPPRSGKTMLLQDISYAVSQNHPEIHLIVLLIDERPEEVTEMRRSVRGEVIASSMDRDIESHVRISQLIFERGKRIAESGRHCFILMDSVTRTARAFNKWIGGGRDSKIGTGGLDVRAMEIPRKMFGTARRFDEGGSLTVCATALIDTGSRMDEAIFQEFKGTGNMELVLSRDLADRRIWPAIDISRSGTRREEKILSREVLDGSTMLRRSLVSMNPVEAMDQLIRTLAKFDTNKEFLERIRSVL